MTSSDPIRVLSADAPKTGLRNGTDAFTRMSGVGVAIDLATAPTIRQRVEAGEAEADVIVIPMPGMADLAEAGLVDGDSVGLLGRVAVGAVVRDGAAEPDLSSVDGFTRSLLDADLVVYNKASSGVYIAGVFERLGLTGKLAATTFVCERGTGVIDKLKAETDKNAIGFTHVTEIRLHEGGGTHLAGTLPGPIARETPYAAGILTAAGNAEAAANLIAYLVSLDGKQHFVAAGVA